MNAGLCMIGGSTTDSRFSTVGLARWSLPRSSCLAGVLALGRFLRSMLSLCVERRIPLISIAGNNAKVRVGLREQARGAHFCYITFAAHMVQGRRCSFLSVSSSHSRSHSLDTCCLSFVQGRSSSVLVLHSKHTARLALTFIPKHSNASPQQQSCTSPHSPSHLSSSAPP